MGKNKTPYRRLKIEMGGYRMFFVGIVLGGILGVLLMALIAAGSKGDD